ncbi:MAG TPA: ATP-binding cassette domain-containing protein [Solirubrobacterales bacterium]|jgi:predicted ABC-type transport system involved in lysophospholipase L1 biosynthesis ATPase subunit
MTTTLETAALSACRGVAVRYGTREAQVIALEEVDLAIEAGETLALRGPSGSGKTTLLHLLGGLVLPSEGEVIWKGRSLALLDVAARGKARAAGIAYVFQGSNLLPNLTALENVAFAAWLASKAGPRPQMEPEELLALVGLEGKADALPTELSGGEAQRVAIARSLAQLPELLLCDEPTGHLDSDTAGRVLDLLWALRECFGFALVLATHDPGVAARCERLVELADGRVTGGSR